MAFLTPRQKTNVLFALALTVIGLITVINLAHFRKFKTSTQDVIHTQTVLRGLTSLYSSLQDAETGQRGYLLTGDPSYLASFQQGKIACPRYFDIVEHLTQKDPFQQGMLARLKILAQEKFNELALTIQLRLGAKSRQANQIVLSNIGQSLMSDIRQHINLMKEHEEMVLKERQDQLDHETSLRMLILFFGVSFSVLMLAWMFYLLKHEIFERQQSEAALRRSEKRLLDQKADLIASNQELEAFCYSVSHDLRTPLRGIGGFSQLISDKYRHLLDAEGIGYLARVHKGIQRMSQLIDDLLNLSRVTRATMTVQDVDLAVIARDIADQHKPADLSQPVEWLIPDTLKTMGDPRLLRAALENLCGNALKFTGRRGAPRIEIGQTTDATGPVYYVRDNGAGFDMAYQDKLFRPFQRLHTTAEFPGTGIGLATVQRIIQRHGGRLWAEGRVEGGATFYFTLRRTHVH